MDEQAWTNNELIEKISFLKQRIRELEQSESDRKHAEDTMQNSYFLLKSLMESFKDIVIFALDQQYRYIAFNQNHCQTMKRIWGVDIALGNSMLEYIKNPEDCLKAKTNFDRVLSGEFLTLIEEYGDTALDRRYYEDSYNPIIDGSGDVIGLTLFLTDITERKRIEEKLTKRENKFRKAFYTSPASINISRLEDGMYVSINQRFTRTLGYTEQDIIGKTSIEYNIWNNIEDRQRLVEGLKKDGEVRNLEAAFRTNGGDIRYGLMSASLLDLDGVAHILSVTYDMTDRKLMEKALKDSEKKYRELSIVDNLTQLYNFRQFYAHLKIETDRSNRYEQPVTLLFLDLDDFKAFNDAYGHTEGDKVLRQIGQVIKRCLRETDFAYRYGGEEFTILLPMTIGTVGAVIAERIREEIKEATFSPVPSQNVHVTASIGFAQYKPQERIKDFVKRVDQLMYQGKKSGKDKVYYEP